MANVGEMIRRMSEYLDKGRPEVKRIVVNCRRQSVLNAIVERPKWRGGPLMYQGREIVTKDPVPRPEPPPPPKAKKKRGANTSSEPTTDR